MKIIGNICDYGCDKEGTYKFKNGKNCCSRSQNECSKIKEKNSLGQKKRQFKWSDEQKQLMSENRKGNKNGMYGKKHKSETKEKIGNRLFGKTYEELYGEEKALKLKNNYSNKMKGRKVWNKGLNGKEYFSKETRNKWSVSCSGEKNGMYGKKHTEKSKISMSIKGKERFKNKEWVKRWLTNIRVRPNKPETILIEFFKYLDLNYEYTGDFKVFIGGRNPDFIDEKNKKIIEFFGDYYHGEKHTGVSSQQNEIERMDHFKLFGYDSLIIWESEFRLERKKVYEKILEFSRGD